MTVKGEKLIKKLNYFHYFRTVRPESPPRGRRDAGCCAMSGQLRMRQCRAWVQRANADNARPCYLETTDSPESFAR